MLPPGHCGRAIELGFPLPDCTKYALAGCMLQGMADLGQALTLVALIAATLEYAFLLRHREERRDTLRFAAEAQEALRSAHDSDEPILRRRWVEGRFRLGR